MSRGKDNTTLLGLDRRRMLAYLLAVPVSTLFFGRLPQSECNSIMVVNGWVLLADDLRVILKHVA